MACLSGLAAVAVISGACRGAQDASVVMTGDLRFDPPIVEVPVGGTVTWENDGVTAHTVTTITREHEPTTKMDSGVVEGTGTFHHTFEEAGRFLYRCALHGEQEMVGVVVVGDG